MPPLVSILCPAYNCETFIGQMIWSIRSQTFQDWELVIVDDGSEDETLQHALTGAREDKRIRAYGEEHAGYVSAFNSCLSLARGRILARQDADDWSDATRLEKQLMLLGEDQDKIVSCGMVRVRNGVRVLRAVSGMDSERYISDRSPSGPCGASLVVWHAVYQRVGAFYPDMEWSPDSDWNFRALLLDDPPIVWEHLDEDLYFYRQHTNQMTKRGRVDGRDKGQEVFTIGQKLYGPQIKARLEKQRASE